MQYGNKNPFLHHNVKMTNTIRILEDMRINVWIVERIVGLRMLECDLLSHSRSCTLVDNVQSCPCQIQPIRTYTQRADGIPIPRERMVRYQ